MLVEEQKSKLRSLYRAKRSSLSTPEVNALSKMANENLIKNLLPQILQKNPHATFGLYLPFGKEMESEMLADFFIKNNIIFSYPIILGMDLGLDFIVSNIDQKFTTSKFFSKIIEPVEGEKIIPDVLILPLLAFDSTMTRLGMGGGFFDRTIASFKNQKSEIITIGLAYEFQRAHEPLPIQNTDQKLDFIVTEKNIFLRS